ncbi:MAG: hypothetical protein ACJ8R9_02715 [Steroidobacteraceae bacterium]
MRVFASLQGKLPGWWVLGDFLVWWGHELRASFADFLEALRIRGSTRLLLRVEAGRLTVQQVRGLKSQELGTLVRNAEGRWPLTLSARDSTQDPLPLAGSLMTAVLPAGDVLIKELLLPAAAENSLDRVLAIQAMRVFPLATTQLYLDHRMVQRIRATKQIAVHLRAAKRAQIDELSQWARSVGGRLDRVCYQASDEELSGNFLPRASWGAIRHFSSAERRLAVGAVFLALAAAGIVGAQWAFERHQVNAELAKIKTHAQQVRATWRQIEAQSAPRSDLSKLMSAPDAATVLGGLPDNLPTDTWVSQIEIRAPSTSAATMQLIAFAPAATKLMDEMARNSHFKHVHLVYAASDGFGNSGDRVQLSAEWAVPATTVGMLQTPNRVQVGHP